MAVPEGAACGAGWESGSRTQLRRGRWRNPVQKLRALGVKPEAGLHRLPPVDAGRVGIAQCRPSHSSVEAAGCPRPLPLGWPVPVLAQD